MKNKLRDFYLTIKNKLFKMGFNSGDYVVVYKGHNSFIDGAVCEIIDRDPMKRDYLVSNLEHVGVAKRSNPHFYQRQLAESGSFWVNESECQGLILSKPNIIKRHPIIITGLLSNISTGLLLGFMKYEKQLLDFIFKLF